MHPHMLPELAMPDQATCAVYTQAPLYTSVILTLPNSWSPDLTEPHPRLKAFGASAGFSTTHG